MPKKFIDKSDKITEEIILKYGFKKYDVSESMYYLEAGEFDIQFESGFIFLDYHKLENIKLIYHLEDLYYSLTGKDLIIKD